MSSEIFFIKLFSIFCIGISAYFFHKVVIQISSKKVAKWMLVIFLLNPFTVWEAFEIRLYAFLVMLSVLAIYYFLCYHFENNKKALLIFSIISLCGIYTQYFFSFLVIAFAIIELVSKRRKDFYQFLYFIIPVIILSLPNLMFVSVGVSSQQSKINNFPFSVLKNIILTPRNLILSINDVDGVWLNRIVRLMIYVPILVAFIIHYIKPNSEEKEVIKKYRLIIISIVVMVALYCIGFTVTEVGYEMKYQTVAFPLLILLLIILWIYPAIIRNFIFGYIALYFTVLLVEKYVNPVKTYDYKSVAYFLQSNGKNNEPIFIYRPVLALPLNYYYHSNSEIIPLPHPVDFNSNYRFAIEDTFQLRNLISPHLNRSKSFFWVSDTTKYEGFVNMNRNMISNYLDTHYKRCLDTFLLGNGKERCLRIRHYEINSD